ncbi:hypothetical protein FQN49_007140 [Arthroderma sp. PD_2]|nr:hypothetical protein FQN49_007140 [Arthroderma sp. PD_2]
MSSSQEDAGHVTALTAPVSASSLQPPASSVNPQQTATKMPPWAIPFDTPARNRFLKDYRTQAASATSTILACLAVTPLENVKTRLQSYNFNGTSDCLRYMLKHEGPRGFMAGALPPLASLTIVRVTNFTVYGKLKHALSDLVERNTGTSPLVAYNTPGSLPTFTGVSCFMLSGMVAGVCAAPIACPFELAKNVVQTSVLMASSQRGPTGQGLKYTSLQNVPRLSTAQAIKQIISRHGFRGLYTGMGLHMARDTVGTGLYFAIYETSKQLISTYLGDHHSPFGPPLVAGALSGIIPWLCTYPLDTRKTRRQSMILGKSKDMGVALAKTSVYTGLSVIILRTAIQNMLLLTMFEYFKREIDKLEVDPHPPPLA